MKAEVAAARFEFLMKSGSGADKSCASGYQNNSKRQAP
jgi:hypothetical protein